MCARRGFELSSLGTLLLIAFQNKWYLLFKIAAGNGSEIYPRLSSAPCRVTPKLYVPERDTALVNRNPNPYPSPSERPKLAAPT